MAKATQSSLKRPFVWEKNYPEGIKWDLDVPNKPLYHLIDETAGKLGDREFMDFLDKKFSYAETLDLINRTAKGLQALGVKKDVKVGLFLPNTPYFVIFYFAILKAGGTVVNFNPLYAEREIAHQIGDSNTNIMVTLDLKALYDKAHLMLQEKRLQKIIVCPMAKILPFPKNILFPLLKRKEIAKIHLDGKKVIAFKDVINNDGKFKPVSIDPAKDVAVMQYTGGTTGVPKGAMLTHRNLYANTLQGMKWFVGFNFGQETAVAVIPFFHVFAMTALMNLQIILGSRLIMLPRFELDQLLKTIHKKKPTFMAAVPTIYNAINNHPERANYDLSSLRYAISGGAPLPVEVKSEFEKNSGSVLREGYGLTESSPIACVSPVVGVNKSGSIGMPLPGTILEVVSLEDQKTSLGIGEKGEICISGPQIMLGYYNKPEETKIAIENGRLHTGDVGYMDEDGYFFIVDRIKDMILVSGYNVYPRNIEEAIYQHPDVEECIVAGIPDQYRGQTVKAFIKAIEGKTLDQAAMLSFLKDKLSPIEMPKIFEFRTTALPKTMIGKLSRKAILEEETAHQDTSNPKELAKAG